MVRHQKEPRISWKIEEYNYKEKSPDWYWALGIIALAGSVLAVIYHDILFGLFILMSAVILGYYASREPDIIDVAIREDGIMIRSFLYPFKKIKGFSIDEHHLGNFLLVETEKLLIPVISVPLPNSLDVEALEELLRTKIPEKHLREPIMHRIMEHIGF